MAPDSAPPAVRPSVEPVPVRPRRRGLWAGIAAAVLVVAASGGGAAWTWRGRPPADLVVTLAARGATPPAPPDLHRAADLLLRRLTAAGYQHPRVSVTGDRTLTVTVAGTGEGLKLLAQPGRLSLRAVVAGPTIPHTEVSAAPADTAVPPAVLAKLGAAYPAARGLTDPGQVGPAALVALAPFGALTPDEVATLPVALQYAVPTITCDQLNGRPPGAVDDPAVRVVACERTGTAAKYLLDPAAVTAADVTGADVELQAASGWTVTISFTPAGQARWTALTRTAVTYTPSNAVAVVVDNEVIAAPTVQAVITGDAAVSGAEIDRDAAVRLAALLRYGPLPVAFTVTP
jgi:preprotein translocase subunit SecD